MELRGDTHQRNAQKYPMVPTLNFYEQPLLPYEKQLIETLGISEQEYREFAAEVISKGRTRPAGYEHIPDVRCDPVSIVISIVVGAILSAVGAALAPKPPKPKKPQERTNTQL